MKIISLGEILFDVVAGEEYLGGAPFNFAVHARRLGHDVCFVSAVGDDERGRSALGQMEQLGLATRFVQRLPGQSTGIVSVSLDTMGQPRFVIHRPAAYDDVVLSENDLAELSTPPADWIYFGTLHQTSCKARQALSEVIKRHPRARRFYDVNLRADSYNAPLVHELMQRSSAVKMNDAEVRMTAELLGQGTQSIAEFCRSNAQDYGWQAVCVTRGAHGCSLLVGGDFVEVEGYPVAVADTVGAGDAFAAAFLHGLSSGWPPAQIGDFANRVGALVASRHGGVPGWTIQESRELVRKYPPNSSFH